MSKIAVNKFMGEAVGLTPRLIPEGFAQLAQNSDLSRGTIKPIKSNAAGSDVGRAGANTIFKTDSGHWLSWVTDVDVETSTIVDDVHGRHYWTGDGAPKMAGADVLTSGVAPYPGASYTLGIPAPGTILLASEPSRTEAPTTAVSTAYAYSYVSTYGEEGPLSGPSAIVTRWDDDAPGNIDLTIPAVNAPGRSITKIRIYRTEGGGTYNLVTELNAGVAAFADDVATANLLGSAQSIDYDPPDTSMIGLLKGPGGCFVGFFGNTLCFSEPGHPHAWPAKYRLAMDYDIVGCAVTSSGIVVLTKGTPALVVGSSPSIMQKVEVDSQQPCVAKNSIVDMGEYVLYASPDGLASFGGGGGGFDIVTKDFIASDDWKALFYPANIKAYRDNDRYVSFGKDGTAGDLAWSFSMRRGLERHSDGFEAAFYNIDDDTVYGSKSGQQTVELWQQGAVNQSAVWRSKIYEISDGASLVFGKVKAKGFPISLELYANEALLSTLSVVDGREFRLPVFPVGTEEIEFSIISDKEVLSIQLAQSSDELI